MEVIPVFSLSPSSSWIPDEVSSIQFVYSKRKTVDEKRNPFVAMNTEEMMRCKRKDRSNRNVHELQEKEERVKNTIVITIIPSFSYISKQAYRGDRKRRQRKT